MAWNTPLDIYDGVVFVDWHGVLSSRRFWSTMAASEMNEDNRAGRIAELFASSEVEPWMLGDVTTEKVLSELGVSEADIPRWVEAVIQECISARPNRLVLEVLRELRGSNYLVLASDNMDCFAAAMPRRHDLPQIFDDYLISSEVGALKKYPHSFFGPWLRRHNLSFLHATLLDDSIENCAAFSAIGGNSVAFVGGEISVASLQPKYANAIRLA